MPAGKTVSTKQNSLHSSVREPTPPLPVDPALRPLPLLVSLALLRGCPRLRCQPPLLAPVRRIQYQQRTPALLSHIVADPSLEPPSASHMP